MLRSVSPPDESVVDAIQKSASRRDWQRLPARPEGESCCQRASERRLFRALIAVLLYGVVLLGVLLLRPGGRDLTKGLDQGLQGFAVLGAIALSFWNGRSFTRSSADPAPGEADRVAHVPRIVAAAMLMILAGLVVELGHTVLTGHDTPTPYWDDPLFLGGYTLFLPAIWLLAGGAPSLGHSVRSLLDGVIVISATIACAWAPVLGPTLQHATAGPWAKVVYSSYPVLSCLVLACLVLAWMRTREPRRRTALTLFTLAGAILAAALTSNIYSTLLGTYQTGDLSDAGWPVGLLFCGLAASVIRCETAARMQTLELPRPQRIELGDGATAVWRVLLPTALLPLAALAAAVSWWADGRRMVDGTIACDGVLASLVFVRQLIALVENSRLTEELRASERSLRHQMRHDALTGLPNRVAMQDTLRAALSAAERTGVACALLLLDLDRFREVNDVLGHRFGDLLLKEASMRLRAAVPPSASLARQGSDEFAVLLPGGDVEQVNDVVTAIMLSLKPPYVVQDHAVSVGATVGAAISTQQGESATLLLQRADVAMHVAKRDQSTFTLYDPALDATDPEQLTLLTDLRESLDRGSLVLHYQPKVAIATGQLCGVEALVRWPHARKGLIPPDRFVPLAEKTGLIGPLTAWVLDAAVAQCAAWAAEGLELQMAVNLSMRNLRDSTIVATVERLLRHHGIPPRLLCLELTESTIMADVRGTQATLSQLAALGVRLAIDDFGTGYSSLSYLATLPVNELKIDRSFVQGMRTQSESQVIVALTIGLAHSLGMEVVTEGVEDAETWAMLAQLGADQAQGYYMSRPVPAEAILKPIITWSMSLSVGNAEIDDQHRRLVGLINHLHEAMNRGRDRDVVGEVLVGLLDYTSTHFATEEQLMLRHTYPLYYRHKAAHDVFTAQVAQLHAAFQRGEVVVTLPLTEFLRDWLTDHIKVMDKELGTFLSTGESPFAGSRAATA